MKNRPITTLFMLMSLDGKITTGAADELDADKDFPKIAGVKEGLHQYYEIEQTTSLWSLNSGRTMEKVGVNERVTLPEKTPVSFVIIDNEQHLNMRGLKYLCALCKRIVIATNKIDYFKTDDENLDILHYESGIDFTDLFKKLKEKYCVEDLTIQSGGTLNGRFLRENLIDYVRIVVAPVLVGGKDTATLIDGESITGIEDLHLLKALKLIEMKPLEDSYIELYYKVL